MAQITLNSSGVASNGSLALQSNGTTTAVTVDASQNVGIGTSSPDGRLHVHNGTAGSVTPQANADDLTVENNANAGISILSPDANVASIYFGSPASAFNAQIESGYNAGAPYLKFNTNAAERMRISSSGDLLVGTTSSSGKVTINAGANSNGAFVINDTFDYQTLSLWNKAGANDNLFARFFTESSITLRGSITYNRGSGVTAYNTTSDYRAKDIIGPVTDALTTLSQLSPYMGVMKGATVERPMFVAHETKSVAPYAVTGEKDAVDKDGNPVFQQIDHSTLVPLLTAAIQEQQAIITQLQADVAALKGTA